jgi:hypothetical protein
MMPSTNGANGRDANGRFGKGNAGGPGNPHAKQVAQLRAALFAAVTEDDLKEVVAALLNRAREGDIAAIRELLDRLLGKAPASVEVDVDVEIEGRPLTRAERRAVIDAQREILFNEPEYLDWLWEKALKEDCGEVPPRLN